MRKHTINLPGGLNMITFLCGAFIGANVGVWGVIILAIMYDKHHPDE